MISLDIEIATFVIQMVATIVLFLAIKIFFTKPMKAFLDKRRAFVLEEFEKAHLAQEEAEFFKEQAQRELEKIQEQADKMLQDASAKAQLKYDDILKAAEIATDAKAEKMRKTIEKERQDMYYDAKKDIAKTAQMVASKLVKKEMNQTIHDDLFGDFVTRIGGVDHG